MDNLKLFDKNEKVIYTLVNTARAFSNEIRITFCLRKCVILILTRGKIVNCDDIALPENEVAKDLEEQG